MVQGGGLRKSGVKVSLYRTDERIPKGCNIVLNAFCKFLSVSIFRVLSCSNYSAAINSVDST